MSQKISIIIITDDDHVILRDTLPVLLNQQYEQGYEVVVVRCTRRGEMTDILEPFLREYNHLKTTFLPDRPQYITDEEVEILLGVKAADNDTIIVVPPDFKPQDDQWLSQMVNYLTDTSCDSNVPLSDLRPIVFDDAHYFSRLGFLARHRHKKNVKKLLKPWCRERQIKRKQLNIDKTWRHNIAIAFRQADYMDDMVLRGVIQRHLLAR